MIIILSLIMILYGIVILSILGLNYWFNYFYLFTGISLLIISRIIKNKYLHIPLILLILIFLIGELFIINFSLSKPQKDADYLIVLGSKTNTYGPSTDFKARLDLAYDYLINNPDTKAIISGAKGDNEPISEALSGKNYLVDKGIDPKRILLEDKSYSTLENITNSKDIILKHHNNLENIKVVIISSNFHLFRANYIAKKIGLRNLSFHGSRGLFILEPHYFAREFFAMIKEVFTL